MRDLAPEQLSGEQPARVVSDLAIIEKAAATGRMFAALRVAQTDAWRGKGIDRRRTGWEPRPASPSGKRPRTSTEGAGVADPSRVPSPTEAKQAHAQPALL